MNAGEVPLDALLPRRDAGERVPPGWYVACASREVRGRPFPLLVAGQPLVLFRDGAGCIAALEDRCAHRNAPLSAGCVREGRLSCPYHGWEYDGDGRVVHIPAAVAGAHAGLRIPSHPVRESQGFVWLWLGDGTPSMPGPPLFPHLGDRGWTSFTLHTRFTGRVEDCLENFLDCPHATFVHRYWFRAPTGKPVRAVVRTRDDGVEAEFFEEPRERSLVWWSLAPAQGAMRHVDRFIAPAASRVDYEFPGGLHYIITSHCTPVDARETQVTTVISFRSRWPGWLVRLFFEPLSRRIIRQDVDMLRLQAGNIARFGGPRFHGIPADLLRAGIVAWRRALAEGTPPPAAGSERHADLHL
jgi:phenylpropionate dioxygenase-like ring-hydroxylating dioxygenase large terminal subunit